MARSQFPAGRTFSFETPSFKRIHTRGLKDHAPLGETPAIYIVFDLLAGSNGKSLLETQVAGEKETFGILCAEHFQSTKFIRLSAATTKLADACKWLAKTGATLDGIIAKRRDFGYTSGERTGMQKIKTFRSGDCVVGGFSLWIREEGGGVTTSRTLWTLTACCIT
jgi:ATP-dependent DNA ligase